MGAQVSMHCAVGGSPVPMVHWFKDGCLLANRSAAFSLQNNGQLLIFRSNTATEILILIYFFKYKRTAVADFGYIGLSLFIPLLWFLCSPEMWPRRMRAFITVKHPTWKRQSGHKQPSYFQPVQSANILKYISEILSDNSLSTFYIRQRFIFSRLADVIYIYDAPWRAWATHMHLHDVVFTEMGWSFVQQPTNLMVKRGDNVTVTCRPPYSSPVAQVSWFKNNQLLSPTAHVTVLPSGDLLFYRCVCVYMHNVCLKLCHESCV